MNQDQLTAQPINLEDLTVQQSEEITGGQTREHILLARQIGVPSATSVVGDWNGDGSTTGGDYIPR